LNGDRALFAPDGRTLATFGWQSPIEIWDLASRKARILEQKPEERIPIAFSPDGQKLAMKLGRDDVENAIHVFDVSTGRLLGEFVGHKQGVRSAAFSPDGRTLASASDDGTLKLWNVATQQELLTHHRVGASMAAVMFSPDNRMLVVGDVPFSGSAGIRFYEAPSFERTDRVLGELGRTIR
jgi:WD40 repeat protein